MQREGERDRRARCGCERAATMQLRARGGDTAAGRGGDNVAASGRRQCGCERAAAVRLRADGGNAAANGSMAASGRRQCGCERLRAGGGDTAAGGDVTMRLQGGCDDAAARGWWREGGGNAAANVWLRAGDGNVTASGCERAVVMRRGMGV